jgi:exosortase family protein XrtM
LALFAGTYAALEVGYCLLPDETLAAVYHWAMAAPMVQLLYLVDPAENVRSISNDLLSNHVNFRIVRGCDASGVLFLLMAAIVTVRAPLADKWKGMLGAIAVAYASNELRILALYITQRVHPSSFTLMHVYVLPLLIILLCVLYFVGWHGRTQQQPG